MNLACPSCTTVYRIDPDRVPERGAVTHCRDCDAAFHVSRDYAQPPGVVRTAPRPETVRPRPPKPEPPAVEASAVDDAAPTPEAVEPSVPEPAEPPRYADSPAVAAPVFGPQDPETRARRLARALVSDMKVYNADKWEDSRSQGTLRAEFREEILKSWDEYVEQVGERMAKRTPYFRNALNEILASGERVF